MKSHVFLAAALVLLTGCSTAFNREWKAAATQSHRGIEGRWQGEWRSEHNGHHGALRAVVTQTSPTTYRAHYHAKFMKILRYSYVATLTGEPADAAGAVKLSGEANLGKLAGGTYTYAANVSPTNFQSTYRCQHDHGNYQMIRP